MQQRECYQQIFFNEGKTITNLITQMKMKDRVIQFTK